MSKATYTDVFDITTGCLKERIKLRQADNSHPLLKHHPLQFSGEKWVLENFWPNQEEVSEHHLDNVLATWTSFYVTILSARIMVEVKAREKHKGGAT